MILFLVFANPKACFDLLKSNVMASAICTAMNMSGASEYEGTTMTTTNSSTKSMQGRLNLAVCNVPSECLDARAGLKCNVDLIHLLCNMPPEWLDARAGRTMQRRLNLSVVQRAAGNAKR